ncbi:MAG: hypothetical protein ACTSX6_02305 [Candidatus Heimdallarchaeaceae archaeon]
MVPIGLIIGLSVIAFFVLIGVFITLFRRRNIRYLPTRVLKRKLERDPDPKERSLIEEELSRRGVVIRFV